MAKHNPLQTLNVDAVVAAPGDAGGTALIAAPAAGKRIRVHSYALTLTAAAAAVFRSGAAGTGLLLGTVRASAAGQGQAEGVDRPDFLLELPEATALFLNVSAAATVSGRLGYSIVNTNEA